MNDVPDHPVVVSGVSGSGKSTVGAALAERLQVPFGDADDLHPESNKQKLQRIEALDDDDRWPWLDLVGEWLVDHSAGGVMACSALTRAHRDHLRHACPEMVLVQLVGRADVLRERQADRPDHFMPAELMTSQLETFEPLAPDEPGVTVDVTTDDVDQIVRRLTDG